MRFFRKKFTDEQKEELQQAAEDLNKLSEELQALTLATMTDHREFLENCEYGRRASLGKPLNPPRNEEIEAMRSALFSYKDTVQSFGNKLRALAIPDWAPSKFSQSRQEKIKFTETLVGFVDMALEGLESPDPLVDQPGEAKLNMFCTGIGLSVKMAEHHVIKP